MSGAKETGFEIICPGLFSSVPPHWYPAPGSLRALETVLSRAEKMAEGSGGPERNLCRRFGVEMADDAEVPAGALLALADGVTTGEQYWLRADPVHLHVDRDSLIAFRLDGPALRGFPANGFVDAFNRHFSAEGWELAGSRPDRWYLRVPHALALRTWPLSEVDGRDVEPFLPSGPGAPLLRRLVAEAEMLLHGFLSTARVDAAQGRRPNSLWLSGGGRLPSAGPCRLDAVVADDPVVIGLARNAGVETASPAAPVPPGGRILCYLDELGNARRSGDAATYAGGLGKVDAHVAAAIARVRIGEVDSVCVSDASTRRWCAEAMQLKRWWRRRKPFRGFTG